MDLPMYGFRVIPLDSTTDTLDAAIGRSMVDSLDGVRSDNCALQCAPANHAVERVIDATPEYLHVYISLLTPNAYGEEVKNKNALQIPEILDITRYMSFQATPTPVRYRLTSVVYHRGGSLRSGHYLAGVTSGRGKPTTFQPKNAPSRPDGLQFFCDDTRINDWTEPTTIANKLTINPVNWSTNKVSVGDCNPYFVWYVREPNPHPHPLAPIHHEAGIGLRVAARNRAVRLSAVAAAAAAPVIPVKTARPPRATKRARR
jgi:hypothetical protein